MDLYIAVSPVPEDGRWQAALVPPSEADDPRAAVRQISSRAEIESLQREWGVTEVRYADGMGPQDLPSHR
jgi:hypothetical protein